MILLRAKDVAFEVTYVDLRDKPGWFLEISPHGKVPVLVVDDQALFESNAIAEYLDETVAPRLHPADPIVRARHRAWTDFVLDFARALTGIYYTGTRAAMEAGLAAAPGRLARLEEAVANDGDDGGPYFGGARLCLVDAAYAPFFQRFALVDRHLDTGLLDGFPLLKAWSDALLATDLVTGSVVAHFEDAFIANLRRNRHYVAGLIDTPILAAQ